MPSWILAVVVFSIVALVIIALYDAIRNRAMRPLGWALAISGLTILVLFLTVGLMPVDIQTFGSGSEQLLVAAMMYVAIIVGILATYLFQLSGTFYWRDFLRPILISPLLLLPLLGSLQGAEMEPLQKICFVVLAFQNGFFWQSVLKENKPSQAKTGVVRGGAGAKTRR